MATYHFDTQDALDYGVESAIILYNLCFWIKHNKANRKHLHDGMYWTYNSTKAFQELFPFWSDQKIGRLLRKLESEGAIVSANFNKAGWDKTKWYSVLKSACLNLKTPLIEIDQPIPDSKPDQKQQYSPNGAKVKKSPTPQPSSPKENESSAKVSEELTYIKSIWGPLQAEIRGRGGLVASKQKDYEKFFKEVDMSMVRRVMDYLRSDANLKDEYGWATSAYNVGELRKNWNKVVEKMKKKEVRAKKSIGTMI